MTPEEMANAAHAAGVKLEVIEARLVADARDRLNLVADLAERLLLASVRGGERFSGDLLAEVSFERADAFYKKRAAYEAECCDIGQTGGKP